MVVDEENPDANPVGDDVQINPTCELGESQRVVGTDCLIRAKTRPKSYKDAIIDYWG